MSNRPHMIFFHHAGGNAASLNTFARRFRPDFHVDVMEMPGRGRRRQEEFKYDAEQITRDFAEKIPPVDRIILVGHSLGAYIAYLMARYYQNNTPEREIYLILVSNDPIHCRQNFPWVGHDDASRQALLDFAECAGQLPDWLKRDEVLRQQFLNVFAADLNVANSISSDQTQPLDDVPMLVIYGEEDPILSISPQRWQECTTGPCCVKKVPGGHFILETEADRVYQAIRCFMTQLNF